MEYDSYVVSGSLTACKFDYASCSIYMTQFLLPVLLMFSCEGECNRECNDTSTGLTDNVYSHRRRRS